MWTGPTIVTIVIIGIGLLWAVASHFIPQRTQRKETDMGPALTAAPWTLTVGRGTAWNLRNGTGHAAEDAFIESAGGEFHESGSTWNLIRPDEVIQVQAVTDFVHATIVVHWTDLSSNSRRTHPITVQARLA